ncbi:DUF6262 family protein [Acidiphilium sp.]|uniref:DUF6262 family protein n=1 Tax=Acidiphilium sp. TaxID=527 RepID=UPI00258BFE3D|nr:DUF6262 family protein [Acidiphilium sp.]
MLKGEENARRLRDYLVALREEGRGLPARDGRPNLSSIAEACGFDRGVFYANQMAKILLDEAIAELGLDNGGPKPADAFEEAQIREEAKARTDGRTKALEEEVLRLRAENAQLKSENERMRAIRALMAETGRTP